MPTYKKNHEVPRSLIQRWASDGTGDVWVFDIDRERMYRSTASGSSPYNFAIVPNRYIVMRGNSRNVDVELWLSQGESALASFVSRVATNSVASLSRDEATALQFGFVGLGFRSAYVIQSWVDALKEAHIQVGIDRYPASDADWVQLALENLLNIVTHRVQELIPPQYEIVQGLWEDVVLSDQAGLVTSHELYVPIDPRMVVAIRQGSPSEFSCVQADQHRSPDLVETLNDLLVQSARRWVVARTEVQLSRYAPMLTKSAVAERIRSSEEVAVSPLPKGKQWWTLR